MTTEIEKQFFKVFGIEKQMAAIVSCKPEYLKCEHCKYYKYIDEYKGRCTKLDYPQITSDRLLEMICIYNSFQNDEGSLLIPFDINNVKDIALQVITKSVEDKSLNNYYCNDVKKLKANIQQLFKEGE